MRIVTVDPNKCVGCRNCEYACAFKQKNDFSQKNSNIRVNVYPEERVCVPMTCVHCEEAWCKEVCPANAISRDEETGAIKVDKDKCAGCKMCMLSCPFGNIHFDSKALVSQKCDLCEGEPNCVKHCISGALSYEDVEEFGNNRNHIDAKLKDMYSKSQKGGNK